MINLTNLCFRYDKSSPNIINNLNLSIKKGMYLSIIGENGSCKTTLIKLILGLLSPASGNIEINTKKIAYVPQRLDGFNPEFPISVYEILKIHGKALKLKNNSEIFTALKTVNMTDHKDDLMGSLSGGQQQRVLIARAIMGNPDLIILDEPSTGLDNKTQQDIYQILHETNIKNHTTIISIEHNLTIATKNSTHILKVKNGNFNLQGTEDFKKSITLGA